MNQALTRAISGQIDKLKTSRRSYIAEEATKRGKDSQWLDRNLPAFYEMLFKYYGGDL